MGEYVGERDAVGARAGRGSYKWPRGAFAYTGEWSNGLMHGHGVLHAGDSTIEGEFHEGEIDGLGVKTWYAVDGGAPTKVYRGELRGGELHGSGELCTSTERYVGAFVGNRREGAHGALTVAAVALELGAWCEATPGDLSEGAWVADVMHGPGALRRGDGFSFRGDFVRGRRTGHGSAEWSGGATYVGVWANDERSRGSYACKQSGVAYDGAWLDDSPVSRSASLAAHFDRPSEDAASKKAKEKKAAVADDDAVVVRPREALPRLVVAARRAPASGENAAPADDTGPESAPDAAPARPDLTATCETGRLVGVTLHSDDGDASDGQALDFFIERPGLGDVSRGDRGFGEIGMRTVDDSLAGGAKGKGAPAARRAVQGLEALVLDAGETLETDWVGPADFWPAQEGATEPADDALSADDSPLADAVPPSAATRTFPPRGGLSIALDFFLSPGALQPGGCAALVEAAAGNALTISLAGRPAAGAAGGGAVDDAADPDASAQTAPCAFVVVVEYRAGDDAPATFEFDAPAFSAGEWHSLAVSFSPFGGAWATRATLDGAALAGAPGERGAAVDGAAAVDSAAAVDAAAADAPCGCTLRVGGGTFAGGVSALRLGVEPCDAGADAPKLAATTACFRAFYAAEAEQAARDAADLAAWEAAWPLEEVAQPPPADAAAKNAAAAKDAAAAKGAAAKKPPQAGEPEAERARKPGAPPRPETMPRAARARRRLATLVGGAVDVAGLRLSARQPPGAYFLRVEDASREGHMRWSDAEQAVFPLLPHADAAFTVA